MLLSDMETEKLEEVMYNVKLELLSLDIELRDLNNQIKSAELRKKDLEKYLGDASGIMDSRLRHSIISEELKWTPVEIDDADLMF